MSTGFRETYKATLGQTTFKTPKPYVVGSNQLQVNLNGISVGLGSHLDYTEVDEYHIAFNYELEDGDMVTLSTSFINHDAEIDIVGYKNSLFVLYGSDERLKSNQRYKIQVSIKGEKKVFSFTSRYNPLYSNVDLIRTDTGDMLDNMSDDKINFIIHMNSIQSNQIILEQSDTTTSETTTKIPYNQKQWVRYKTLLDLTNAIYLTASGNVGSISKKIGPIDISRNIKVPFIKDMMYYFKSEFDKYDMSFKNPIMSSPVIKAGQSAYPIAARRNF